MPNNEIINKPIDELSEKDAHLKTYSEFSTSIGMGWPRPYKTSVIKGLIETSTGKMTITENTPWKETEYGRQRRHSKVIFFVVLAITIGSYFLMCADGTLLL